MVGAGAVEIHQDAFFIDPSGVVYDSETFAPLAGATVTLEHNGQPVPDSWLNLTLGFANGSITGSDGLYAYVLDPTIAPSGIYTLRVERQGCNSSDVYKAVPGALTPTLGGGIQQVVLEATPSESMFKLYYMSFDFTFVPANAASTSNGIIHNHIPLDADLLGSVKADVQAILRDDLAMTLQQQSRTMQGYAESALKRLQSQDGDGCQATIEAILFEDPLAFAGEELAPESASTLDEIAAEMRTCPDSRFEVGVYADSGLLTAEAQALTDNQAARLVTELRSRDVDGWQISARGYGTAEASRSGSGGVVFTILQQSTGGGDCVDTSTSSHALTGGGGEDGSNLDGSFSREDRDCDANAWRIVSGTARHMSSDNGIGLKGLSLTPRAGLDVAWSPGGNGDLTVTRGLLKEAGSVTVPQVIGMRLFASVRVEDLLPASNALLSVTPGLFCDRGFEERSTDCGISARVELSSDNEDSDRHYAIAIDLEGTAETVSTCVELSYGQMLGEGKVEGGVTFGSSGDAGLTGQYELEF